MYLGLCQDSLLIKKLRKGDYIMKKLIKNYLAKLQENDKKGFSLVELIIVMAIMAILVGVVASQVLPYMEKSRQSKDQQVISAVLTDIQSAVAQSGEACIGGEDNLANLANIANTRAVTEFQDLRSGSAIAAIESACSAQFGSKLFKGGSIMVSIDNSTGKICVYVPAMDSKGSKTPGKGDKNYVETE